MTFDPQHSRTHSDGTPGSTPLPLATEDAVQALVAEAREALAVVDAEGVIRLVNAATEALFGRSAMNLLGHEFGFPLAHAQIGDLTIVRPDQSVAIINLEMTEIAWYGEAAYLVRMSDVTFERRGEQLLVESQQLLHQALDSMASGVVMIDTEGVIIAANHAWQSFLATQNFPPEYGKIGSSYLRLAKRLIAASEPPSPTMLEGLHAVLAGQRSHYQSEYALVMDQGTRWFAMNVLACREGYKIYAIVTHEETTRQHQRDDLEIDSRQTLELIARQRSLEAVVARILLMTQNRHPDSIYIALLVPDAEVFRSLPSEMLLPDELALLDRWAKDYALSANDAEGDTLAIQAIDMAEAEALWPALRPLLSARHIVMVWRAPVRAGALGVVAQLICCRRVSLVPNADDLVFMELVGQLLAIAIEQHEHTRQLAYQSYHDPLTGLPNRLLFEDRLHQALEIARRSGNLMAVMMLDLDRFKQINDTLGHTVGDTLLIQLARRFEGCVRTTDTLARRGGDEFMLVLPDVSGAQQVTRVARRLHDALRTPFVINQQELFVSASIGASLYPHDGENADALQRSAEAAMYRAKSTLRNSFQFFDATVNTAALARLQLETHLRRAIERGELSLHYQAKVDRERHVIGAESLLRWQHPDLGQIPPARFIPLAEELGLIVPIGEWCLRELCRQIGVWDAAGLPAVRIAVNVSALQFSQQDFIATLTQILAETNVAAERIEIELTESMLMGNVEAVMRQLSSLRSLGLSLAIDDFGTGFSSLAYLQRLPISVLKIDRSFVSKIGFEKDSSDRGIVNAIITLAHHLSMQVVAEGVETTTQYQFLHDMGCDFFQGYLFSKPIPPEQFAEVLRTGMAAL
ncbi:sensor domain-containing protein [Candidatus Chloroploca asiatica]|uniref:Diguanylate cyclase n=1 Tax=Candidatus Chloroploca asiatica TaxID=1506545 RepID=A0A2H3L3I6_9CHLR|nr:bifunctional diguanylate cyclase/phosphodiesterase [Candidatus Chloroploca asiatica]PDV99338.1 hypothetical protein A9Q02_12615 [Candidatus Chloroploca asiatica]